MSYDPHALFEDFDGKDPAPLVALAGELAKSDDGFETILAALTQDDEKVQTGATWILKHWIEAGCTVDRRDVERVIAALEVVRAKDAQLHLLQILPFLELDPSSAERIFDVALALTRSRHTFVRAWAYNALAVAAALEPERRDEVDRLFDAAATDRASVRARIRNARKGQLRPSTQKR